MISMSNLFLNNTFVNIAQSTKMSMSIETALKATGRPTFIMADKNISSETKKYAAAKELLYQLTCLGLYLAFVLPVFRKGGFQLFKKIYKDRSVFNQFSKLDEFSKFWKLSELPLSERLEKLADKKISKGLGPETIKKLQLKKIHRKHYHIVKGADEFCSIAGSVVGLAILAPQVSHVTIHPIMKFLGLKTSHETAKTDEKSKQPGTKGQVTK